MEEINAVLDTELQEAQEADEKINKRVKQAIGSKYASQSEKDTMTDLAFNIDNHRGRIVAIEPDN